MTIKEFSKLCGCNPQTLRYYDRQDLLKPVKVDEWSGYRFYDEEQAFIFVKIKNLQKAGFTIDEVRELLKKDDTEIFYAFEDKISEEEAKIREIREIQKTYQADVMDMRNRIEEFRDVFRTSMQGYDPCEEFGIDGEAYADLISRLNSLFDQMIEDRGHYRFEYNDYSDDEAGADEDYFRSSLEDPGHEVIFERHNWTYACEFFYEIPEMNDEDGYLLLFKVDETKSNKTAFANTVIGMCLCGARCRLKIGCTVIDSEDGKNHFWLVRYRDMI